MINSGKLGDVTQFYMMYNIHHADEIRARYPGVIRQILTHHSYTMLYLAGQPKTVSCLKLTVDDIRGLAFLLVDTEGSREHQDDWQHPLVRRQRMNLEQSLMVAILRQHFVAHELEAGIGDKKAIVHLDDLLPQLNPSLNKASVKKLIKINYFFIITV